MRDSPSKRFSPESALRQKVFVSEFIGFYISDFSPSRLVGQYLVLANRTSERFKIICRVNLKMDGPARRSIRKQSNSDNFHFRPGEIIIDPLRTSGGN